MTTRASADEQQVATPRETKANGAKARSSGGDKPPLCRKQRSSRVAPL